MTAYVMEGLTLARRAGVVVDDTTYRHGLEALKKIAPTPYMLMVRAAAGIKISSLTNIAPKTMEDLAYLVLAGRTNLARELSWVAPKITRYPEIREAALVLRALNAANPKDARIDTIVNWLLSVRRGSQWWSTLDTADCVRALIPLCGPRKEASCSIRINGKAYEPVSGLLVLSGSEFGDTVSIEMKGSGDEPLFVSITLAGWTEKEDLLASEGALRVTRQFLRKDDDEWVVLKSGEAVKAGAWIRVRVTIETEQDVSYVMYECPIPGGVEARPLDDEWFPWWDSEGRRREFRDDRVIFAPSVGHDQDDYEFLIRAIHPGDYHIMPALAGSMYETDLHGASDEFRLKIIP